MLNDGENSYIAISRIKQNYVWQFDHKDLYEGRLVHDIFFSL